MKISVKKIFVLGLIIFLLIQFYQPARNVSSEKDMPEDFTNVYAVPKNVATILRTSCYDCHSNNTEYPWYSYIQPVRMFMDNHIKEGKENLNFSEFGNYSERKQANKLEEIVKQIKADEMPLASYTLIHRNAVLSTTQKIEVIDWIYARKDSISRGY
jgi:hypothetical protein